MMIRLPYPETAPAHVTVPSAEAKMGVPSPAFMSMPLWNAIFPVNGLVRIPNGRLATHPFVGTAKSFRLT